MPISLENIPKRRSRLGFPTLTPVGQQTKITTGCLPALYNTQSAQQVPLPQAKPQCTPQISRSSVGRREGRPDHGATVMEKGGAFTWEKKNRRDVQAQMRMGTISYSEISASCPITRPLSPGIGLDISDSIHRKDAFEAALWGKPALEEGGQDASFPSKLRHSSSSGMHFLL